MSHTPVLYDSAYPGSMCKRDNGDYVAVSDNASLAAALLQNIYDLRNKSDGWRDDAIMFEKKAIELSQQRDTLLAALKRAEFLFADCPFTNPAMTSGHKEIIAAIASIESPTQEQAA